METEELFASYKNLYGNLLELSSSINISMSHIWNFLNTNLEILDNHQQQGEQLSVASEEMSKMTLEIAKNAAAGNTEQKLGSAEVQECHGTADPH
ncbi:MAG: hypothetical protein ABFR82_02410 [Nitrospirota bacterium]